ncbi:efflux RND transporter periplasmic adaptor subunit [Methyloligella sp. 2.7D]|uniref:efflux RND transporter periplasmic adaptor subunit n=1 Tax=unclassified Methyloligella TaxID=2625955 RepID=UPI00157C386C|nr:efflux RND transporter periplasmic adaptor subunit [Methyloligella sp. GL2]QKP78412.1 efflux RND transporter periplasmic adaptor subunit [Methyloligella sp. GL2]
MQAFLAASFFLLVCAVPASAQTDAPPVETETAKLSPVVRELELSATVTSPRASQISTSVDGLVSAIYYDSGAEVKQGDLLLELDAEIEEAAYSQAEALTHQAEAELADSKRRLRIADKLASRNYGTQNEAEARAAEVEIDTAALESRKAELARRAAILERHKLRAPYDGIISERMAELGQWLATGTAAFELVAMKGLRIDAPVPQQYFAQVSKGAEASLVFDAIPGKTFPAKIGALIPVSDPDARTFTLRVLPVDENLPITPGMSARTKLKLKTGDEDVVVSRDALIRHPDGRITVWVVEEEDGVAQVKERKIEIGLAFGGMVQVLSGLKDGEQVVVRGNESLHEGQAVRLAS